MLIVNSDRLLTVTEDIKYIIYIDIYFFFKYLTIFYIVIDTKLVIGH